MGDHGVRPEIAIRNWLQDIYSDASALLLLKCAKELHALIVHDNTGVRGKE
jgi:hypothetical protein